MDYKNILTNKTWWLVIIIILVTFLTYYQVLHYDFVNFDDDIYIYENSHMKSGFDTSEIIFFFTNIYMVNWIPLTLVSHMMDVQFFGLSPGGHHFTSLFFHILNSLLLFFLLKNNTNKPGLSFIAAMLFAVHPLHVESVAWISERKDVLSCFFGLWAIIFYCKYARRPSIKYYLLAIIFFLFSLLSKQTLVTLPVLLFLIDFWPLQRVLSLPDFANLRKNRFLIIEKIPFLILSIIFSIITIFSQKTGQSTMVSLTDIPFLTRVGNALVSYANYLYKTIWPFKLAVIYPYQPIEIWSVMISIVSLSLISVFVIIFNKKHPYLIFGWLWFLISMLPVIGFIQVGSQSMADRYTYIPLIGIFIAAVWGVHYLTNKFRINRKIVTAVCGVLILVSSKITMGQINTWQNSITLFTHALSVTENNWKAHLNLGAAFDNKGQTDEAILQYKQALKINKNLYAAWLNTGNAYFKKEMYDKSVLFYGKALELRPNVASVHCLIGISLGRTGNLKMAIQAFENALKIHPGLEVAIKNKKIAEELLKAEER